MKQPAKKMGRPSGISVEHDGVIALRMPAEVLTRTLQHAKREDRTKSNFARRIYLLGLEKYEASLAANGIAA